MPPRTRRSLCCGPVGEDVDLLVRLRAGDEDAFITLVRTYNESMLRVARSFVSSNAVAEEVVQDTWMGVVRGLDRFEERSSFKTWLFGILVKRARSTGVREHRSLALDEMGPVVDAARFDVHGNWISPPDSWSDDVVHRLQASDAAPLIRVALDALPAGQRAVVTLRDVEGLSSREVCLALSISEGNQRVLLHRGRSHLRQTLEHHLRRVL
jgi:RNA polymerase sigma-70 factor (ECF subfamily)